MSATTASIERTVRSPPDGSTAARSLTVAFTAAHFMCFLDWAEKKGELPASTVQNWRIASTKVLEIEHDWQELNVVDLDLEAHSPGRDS
jgi:hypothetical protein